MLLMTPLTRLSAANPSMTAMMVMALRRRWAMMFLNAMSM